MRAAILALLVALAAGCFTKPERLDGVPVDGAIDAPPASACTPARCPGMCTPDGFCEIMGSSAPSPLRCPAGLKCRVRCDGGKCKAGVECGAALECDVHCDGKDACKDGGVDCGTAAVCTVDCEGEAACQGQAFPAVDCGDSQCRVECDGVDACQKGVRSTGGSCTAACCGGPGTCQESDGSCTRTSQCD